MAERLTDAFLIRKFNEIIGWPYASPGTNDENGIDCSGAFVRAYRAAGKSIYHGSNRIERVYCRDCFDLNGSTAGLKPGMAMFKFKEPGEAGYGLGDQYRPGGAYYNGDVRDYSHIGLCASVKPLKIPNATGPVARVDTKLGSGIHAWRRAGYLKAVIYSAAEDEPATEKGAETMSEWAGKTCTLKAEGNDSPVNLRGSKSTGGALVARIPQGGPVLCETDDGTWAKVRWDSPKDGKTYKGYVMSQFLAAYGAEEEDGDTSTGTPENGAVTGKIGPYCVCLYCDTLGEAEAIVRVMKKATVEAG